MILICFGTRPEYIKVKSLIENLDQVKTCFTGQHEDLLKNITVDYKLNMSEDISDNRLNNIFCNIMKQSYIFDNVEYVLVQGDTSSACAMAISAFNNHKKIIHLEAGLRSNNISDPYPEEANRQIISRLANIHFCPTNFNRENLTKENITKNIYVIGNTDLDNIPKQNITYENIILVTLHRRDNHEIMDKWFEEIEKLSNENKHLQFIIPIHPNPNVRKHKHIFKTVNVIDPLSHSDLIDLIKKCRFIISDSGSIQEEASFLNKRIIVCRKTTERPETIGTYSVLCDSPSKLKDLFYEINKQYKITGDCPYGDGNSWRKIHDILSKIK